MHPVLVRLPIPGFGPIAIYAYGVMLGLSLVVGWYLTLGLAKKDGLPPEKMANNYVVTALTAVVMSRVLYVLTNLSEFDSFGAVFSFRSGGLVAYGGFLGGLLGSYVYLRLNKLPLLPWADVAVPSLASGLMITRIGCYMFGCDFGQPLGPSAPSFLQKLGTFPHWADHTIDGGTGSPAFVQHVKTRGLSPDALHSLPVHPTQLYESLVGASILVLLLVMRRHQRFRGQIFFIFTIVYGFARFLLELVRDDMERGDIPPALPEQVLISGSLALFAVAFAVGVAPAIKQSALRVTLQGASFIPGIWAYVAMQPGAFTATHMLKLSTSQAIGLGSAVLASVAYGILHRAALRHPESAMALDLPPELDPALAHGEEEDEDEVEADDTPKAKQATAVAAKKTAAKKTAAKEPAAKKVRAPIDDEAEDGGDESHADDDDTPKSADEPKVEKNDAERNDDDEAGEPPPVEPPAVKKEAGKRPPKAD